MILFLIAIFFFLLLAPICFLYGIIRSAFKKVLNDYFKSIAYTIDQSSGVIGKYLFDDILIKKTGYSFGNPDETISSVLGKNCKTYTLTKVGYLLSKLLNAIDKDHVVKYIEKDENNKSRII